MVGAGCGRATLSPVLVAHAERATRKPERATKPCTPRMVGAGCGRATLSPVLVAHGERAT
jgi:hypothetical protein